MNPNYARAVAMAVVLWCLPAAGGAPPVVVELEQDAPEIDGTELRDAVARELGAPVVSEEAPGGYAMRLTVRIDHTRRQLEVDRAQPLGEALVRRVPLPADPAEVLRTAVFLIGNLARDEAAAVLRDLHPVAAPATAPASPVAPARPADSSAPLPPASRPSEAPLHAIWVGASVEGDVMFLPGANDVCVTQATYVCVDSDGGDPWATLAARRGDIVRGVADQVMGGARLANVRFLVAVDLVVSDHVLLGGRVGFATGTYPGSGAGAFGPLHAEARATYVFGTRPLATSGLFPALVFGVGVAEHSAGVPVVVEENTPQKTRVSGVASAWKIAGPGFASAGLGLRWALSSDFALSILPLKTTLAFGKGDSVVLLSPDITAQIGF